MAKVNKELKKFEFSKVSTLLDNIAKTTPIRIVKEIKEKSFISTGVYILDACLSARMLGGGIPTSKIVGIIGESGSGKSYIAYSICKSAQKNGYSIIFIDTEESIDLEDFTKYGVDNSQDKMRLIKTNKVEDINITLTQLLDDLKEQKIAGYEIPKIMIVLDSIGMLSSQKEKSDLISGNIKQDMTRAKALNAMFRSINSDLGFLDIPMVCTNHSYLSQDLFPKEIAKGGMGLIYSASVLCYLSKSKLKDGNEDEMDLGQSGISVLLKTQKNRLAKPKKIRFDISFIHGMNPYTGLDAFLRPEFFDKTGVACGKMEVDKNTGEMTFTPGGNRWYVSHLGKSVTTKQLFTTDVFTPELLEKLNPIVSDYFKFKSLDEMEKTEKEFESIIESLDSEIDSDNFDAGDLFE